jgi:hypothetical protein
LLSEYLFRRGLQNSEMCLLFNVGTLTRNRYRDSMMLTAFDTSDGPLVGTNSPHAEMDYCMRLLSWEPPFGNILMPELAHLSTYRFIEDRALDRKDPWRRQDWKFGRMRLAGGSHTQFPGLWIRCSIAPKGYPGITAHSDLPLPLT